MPQTPTNPKSQATAWCEPARSPLHRHAASPSEILQEERPERAATILWVGEQPTHAIPVAELVSALSLALDLTDDAVPGHALRSCLLGLRIAEAIGMGEVERSNLFYALLLKDIGCSSNAARLHQIMGSDERRTKWAAKRQDWTRTTWSGVRTTWNNFQPGAPTGSRLVRLVGLGLRGNVYRDVINLRCHRGARIISRLGLHEDVSVAVRHLDEHWDGSGLPDGLREAEIPFLSRLILLAQHLDVVQTSSGRDAAIARVQQRSGRWFDPELVRAAKHLHRSGLLWAELDDEDCQAAVLAHEPGQRLLATEDQIDSICEAFAEVVDIKSTFTGTHSRGVALAAEIIATTLGLSPERQRFVARASLLHDLGKLRVPNTILDKAGQLTTAEWAIVREHPALTRRILSHVKCFAEMAVVAGQHHEKLDGSGYPDGLLAPDLSLESRVIAVADVFGALAEDRPYRSGLPPAEIRRIMERECQTRLDAPCYEALVTGLRDRGGEFHPL